MLTRVVLTGTFTPNTSDPNIQMSTGLEANRLVIEATDGSDNPVDIFVYQTEVLDLYEEQASANADTRSALFVGVASPNDLQELPVGVPGTSDDVDMFMLASVDVLTRSMDESVFIWDTVVAEVRALVRHHKLLEAPPSGLTQVRTEDVN